MQMAQVAILAKSQYFFSFDRVMPSRQLFPYAEAIAEYKYLELWDQKIKLQDIVDYTRFVPSQSKESVEQGLQETRRAIASMRQSWKKHGHNV